MGGADFFYQGMAILNESRTTLKHGTGLVEMQGCALAMKEICATGMDNMSLDVQGYG